MHRLLTAIKKETLMLVRDIPGLVLLFAMPLLLVFVVTLAQDSATREPGKEKLCVRNLSGSPLSKAILTALDSSALFMLVHSTGSGHNAGCPAELVLYPGDSAITVTFSPDVNLVYKKNLFSSLNYLIKSAQARQAMELTLDRMLPAGDTVIKGIITTTLASAIKSMPSLEEDYPSSGGMVIRPSVIQNNVPGFILFAMFFIVLPLSSGMILEKNEGSFLRLQMLPRPWLAILSAKVVVYLAVCLLQFLLMLMMGFYVFPGLLDLPPLSMGTRYTAMILATLAASLAAIGFGIVTGTLARTVSQAALFGSVIVVILGILSGTFLPVHMMPKAIEVISRISPMRWGIDCYLAIFLGENGWKELAVPIFLLLLFFILAMTISIFIFAKKRR